MNTTTTQPQPPATLRLADGNDIPHEIGQRIFNYYDMEAGTITRLATYPEPDTSGQLPNGLAWWIGTTCGTLDGSRMVTIETAQRKGWI
jgi:hypothetical protein